MSINNPYIFIEGDNLRFEKIRDAITLFFAIIVLLPGTLFFVITIIIGVICEGIGMIIKDMLDNDNDKSNFALACILSGLFWLYLIYKVIYL